MNCHPCILDVLFLYHTCTHQRSLLLMVIQKRNCFKSYNFKVIFANTITEQSNLTGRTIFEYYCLQSTVSIWILFGLSSDIWLCTKVPRSDAEIWTSKDWHIYTIKQTFRIKQLESVQKICFHEIENSGIEKEQKQNTRNVYCVFIQYYKTLPNMQGIFLWKNLWP